MAFMQPQPPPPLGFRFRPTDVELVNYYLMIWVDSNQLPSLYPKITYTDVYADHPSKVFESQNDLSREQEDDDEEEGCCEVTKRYFVTPLKKVSEGSSRICRRVQNHGTWSGEIAPKSIMFRGEVIGHKKYFIYTLPVDGDKQKRRKRGRKDDNQDYQGQWDQEYDVEWSMHEYTRVDDKNNALCCITRKRFKNFKKSSSIPDIVLSRLNNSVHDRDHQGVAINNNEGSSMVEPQPHFAQMSSLWLKTISPPQPPPPIGYRYCPTDVELVSHYLLMWLNGQPLPWRYPTITYTDLYEDHPSKVFEVGRDPYIDQEEYQDQEEEEEADGGGNNNETTKRYFMTPLKKKVRKDGKVGLRVGRRASNGTWKGEYSKPISVLGQFIGWKKYLKYIPDDKKCKKRGREGNDERELINCYNDDVEWLMHEYTHVKDERFALCRMTRRRRRRGVNNNNSNNCNIGEIISTKMLNVVVDDDHHMKDPYNNWLLFDDELIMESFNNFNRDHHMKDPYNNNTELFDDQSIMDLIDFDDDEEWIENQVPHQQEAAFEAKLRN